MVRRWMLIRAWNKEGIVHFTCAHVFLHLDVGQALALLLGLFSQPSLFFLYIPALEAFVKDSTSRMLLP
jgi:hypothetical protein